MRKKREIILTKDIKPLGSFGDIKEVAAGYARNFLIPRGYALYLKDPRSKEIIKKKKEAELLRAKEAEEAKGRAQKLEGTILRLTAKAGSTGRLFGSIGPKEIAQKISQEYGLEVKKEQVKTEAIKNTGEKEVRVDFIEGISAKIKVIVEPAKEEKTKSK